MSATILKAQQLIEAVPQIHYMHSPIFWLAASTMATGFLAVAAFWSNIQNHNLVKSEIVPKYVHYETPECGWQTIYFTFINVGKPPIGLKRYGFVKGKGEDGLMLDLKSSNAPVFLSTNISINYKRDLTELVERIEGTLRDDNDLKIYVERFNKYMLLIESTNRGKEWVKIDPEVKQKIADKLVERHKHRLSCNHQYEPMTFGSKQGERCKFCLDGKWLNLK
jgi:hypothetical protein